MKVNNYLHHNHCLNHGLNRLIDFTDWGSKNRCNLCHLSNPIESVIQTTIAENYKALTI